MEAIQVIQMGRAGMSSPGRRVVAGGSTGSGRARKGSPENKELKSGLEEGVYISGFYLNWQ